jgi:hypothetical protein
MTTEIKRGPGRPKKVVKAIQQPMNTYVGDLIAKLETTTTIEQPMSLLKVNLLELASFYDYWKTQMPTATTLQLLALFYRVKV